MSAPVTFRTAIVSVALDKRDRTVLDAIAQLSGALGLRRVVLVHVAHLDPLADPILGGITIDKATIAAPEGLAGYAHELSQRIPEVEIIEEHRAGTVHEQIIQLAVEEDADLVVLGRRKAFENHTAWGSRGVAVARHAARSVLVIPDDADPGTGEVVVGVDFSHTSNHALAVGVSLGQKVRAIYAYKVDPAISYGGLSPQDFEEHVQQNALRHFIDDVLPTLPQGAAEPKLTCLAGDRVSDTLIAEGEKADLLVIGGQGRTRLASMLLGSTAERVAGRCGTAVLVVREKGERMGLLESLLHR